MFKFFRFRLITLFAFMLALSVVLTCSKYRSLHQRTVSELVQIAGSLQADQSLRFCDTGVNIYATPVVLNQSYQLPFDGLAWKKVEITKEDKIGVNARVLYLLGDLQGIEDLCFSCLDTKLSEQDFESVLGCDSLKILQITSDSLPENRNEVSKLEKLRSLIIYRSEIDMQMANAIYSLPKLVHLDIRGKISKEAEQKLLNKPGLKYVFIQNQQSDKKL